MASHNQLGRKGEDFAADYLLHNGYNILAVNWRYGKTEIDIIASNSEFIIFVEVKTRTSMQWGYPEEAVSESKRKRMVEAADYYIHENDSILPIRFDIISLIRKENEFEIEHFEDAFLAPLN